MEMTIFFSWIIAMSITGAIFGFATNAIIQNKGYREDWFWWGFFFGIIAMLVAMSKPEKRSYRDSSDERSLSALSSGWKCPRCGRVNANYVGTCGCGYEKSGNMPQKNFQQTQQNAQTEQSQVVYCTSCGKQVETDSKFCRYCGAEQ